MLPPRGAVRILSVSLALIVLFLLEPAHGKGSKKKSKLFADLEKANKLKPATNQYPTPRKEVIEPGYNIGKVLSLYLPYSILNGWMSPFEAEKLCEADLQCGGFTYLGAIPETEDDAKTLTYRITFYRSVLHADLQVPEWTTYLVKRSFITIPGRPLGNTPKDLLPKMATHKQLKLLWTIQSNDLNTIQATTWPWDVRELSMFAINSKTDQAINLNHFELTEVMFHDTDWTIIISTNRSRSGQMQHVHPSLDLCCSKTNGGEWDTFEDYFTEGNVPRVETIPCDISKEDFEAQYVRRNRVAKLTGCDKQKFSMNDVLQSVDEWEGFVKVGEQTVQPLSSGESAIRSLLKKERTFLVTSALPKTLASTMKRPSFLPDDLRAKSTLGHTQHVVALGQNTTGFLDYSKPLSDSLITLLSGRKFWYFYPPDVSGFKCKSSCSDKVNPLLQTQRHINYVLPQILHHRYYGQRIQVTEQLPGEALFIPGRVERSGYNMDTTLSLMEDMTTVSNIHACSANPDMSKEDIGFVGWITKHAKDVIPDEQDRRKMFSLFKQQKRKAEIREEIKAEYDRARKEFKSNYGIDLENDNY